MDTFRKWLNKPKADDKSLLARFYHADRSLTAVASELDSFDGRTEPERCSRLVTRLRQGQEKVLAITNLIMEELLGEERDVRAFRAKFPEEVLQENLAGQLWFGAECLAAGSSIMNREQESKEMRPLAQAVTKSLGNVRSLLREQCLRNNVPNSKRLQLDANDATTEQLYESLKIFDRLFAEFELRYVSAMVQVKTKQEYEMQELICVLFSETLQRALKLGLIEQDKVDAFDPALMFSIPRLAIIAGLIVYPVGPLNMDMTADQLSEMFRPFRTILTKIRDLLRTLNKAELFQLQKLLCTNEDIQIKLPLGRSSIEAPTVDTLDNSVNSKNSAKDANSNNENYNDNNTLKQTAVDMPASSRAVVKRQVYRCTARSPSIGSSISVDSSIQPSTPHSSRSSLSSRTPSNSLVSSVTAAENNWSDDDDDEDEDDDDDELACAETAESDVLSSDEMEDVEHELDIVKADCASGYLIPNTNFGNLLQPQEIPLTSNFVATDDEFVAQLRALGSNDTELPTTSGLQQQTQSENMQEEVHTSQRLNRLRLSCSSEDSDRQITTVAGSTPSSTTKTANGTNICGCNEELTDNNFKHTHHHHHHHHHRYCRYHRHYHHHHHHHSHSYSHQHQRNFHSKSHKRHSMDETTKDQEQNEKQITEANVSSADANVPTSLSDDEFKHEVLRTNGRLKFKSTENLLHRLFVCIAGVADQLQTNFASDLRQILRSVFLMNMSSQEEQLDIPEKVRDSELFEFRASEQDVIQQQSGGSNQSIYSAEEVNTELDNVFNNNNRNRHSTGATVQRAHTMDAENHNANSAEIVRSHSLGDEQQETEQMENNLNNSSITAQEATHYRKNSISSSNNATSSSSGGSSENNSPISDRAAANYMRNHNNNNNNNNNNNTSISSTAITHQSVESSRRLSPPAWIPDDKAPRCMSCRTPFTAFRRRHHCRNCGGVFCGVCSNSSTPLPKYGLTKAVRVCRDCYMREILSTASATANQYACTGTRPMHASNNTTTTAGGL